MVKFIRYKSTSSRGTWFYVRYKKNRTFFRVQITSLSSNSTNIVAKISKTNHRGCIFVFIIYDNDLKKLHHLSSVENFFELLPKIAIFFPICTCPCTWGFIRYKGTGRYKSTGTNSGIYFLHVCRRKARGTGQVWRKVLLLRVCDVREK